MRVKAQTDIGRGREICYFRDEQGAEVDFLVPGKSGAVALIECRASRTVSPAMAMPMQRLAEAVKKKAPQGNGGGYVFGSSTAKDEKSHASRRLGSPGSRFGRFPRSIFR